MIVSRKYEIGQVVEVSRSRNDIYNAMPPTWEVPQGWRGRIIKEGVTADGLYYAYDLQGEDGTILENYPSPCLLPVASGSDRSISKIIGNMILGTDDTIEQTELESALNFILDHWDAKGNPRSKESKKSLMYIAYQYGKTVGIREERQRKKTLSEEKI
jgi:hypothetical protein